MIVNGMDQSDTAENINKVYISDSPVNDDNIEYNYVSSDIEDDIEHSPGAKQPPITEPMVAEMPPQPDTSEADELAKEAEYQRELQERLQNTTLEDQPPAADGGYADDNWEAESNSSGSSSPLSSNSSISQGVKSKTPKSKSRSRKSKQGSQSNGSPEQQQVSYGPGTSEQDLLEWKNPPANPFAAADGQDSSRYEDVNASMHEEQIVPQNMSFPQQQSPARRYPQSVSPSVQQSRNSPQRPLTNTNIASPQKSTPDYHQQQSENIVLQPQTVVQQPDNNQLQYNQYTYPSVPAAITQPNHNQTYQQPQPTEQTVYQQPQYNANIVYNNDPKYAQAAQQYSEQIQQFGFQNPQGVIERDPYLLQQEQAELERIQYQQLQQQQLQQQQLFAQQQLLQQQQQQQQLREQQFYEQQQQMGIGGLQRNAPVMYMGNAPTNNEYYATTPRDAYHPYNSIPGFEQFENDSLSISSQDELMKKNARQVAPKPSHPQKNFLEKNIHHADGQHSAKPGYSQRLQQKRIEQEQMKDWAPGMVLPRKKAASADDIIRGNEREEAMTAEDAWSKRSRSLANAKQSKVTAAKSKKSYAKQGLLKRYPSDNSLTKKTNRVPVPPISQPKERKGYLTSYQQAAHGWSDNDLTLNGQISPTGASPNGLYNKQIHPNQFNQSHPPVAAYQSHIPHHPPVYSGGGSPLHAPQQSPVYGGGINGYGPQYQGYDMQYVPQAPNSGGYHHHQRMDQPHVPMESPVQQRQGYPNHYQASYGPPPGQHYQQVGVPQQQPAYDYSGYLNNYRPVDQVSVEESKPYEGSPYSSPHPPYSGGNSTGYKAPENTSAPKKPLNPYTTVPPIHHAKPNPKPQGGGSYVMAYQKDKEKAEKLAKPPTYKVYTMKDYKKLKLEYKLGGLGPSQDPQLVKEKNDTRLKQLQYAKEAMEKQKSDPNPSPRKMDVKTEEEPPKIQEISSRQLAVEYAKHVPKPRVGIPQRNTQQPQQTSPTHHTPAEQAERSNGKIAAMQPVHSSAGQPHHGYQSRGLNGSQGSDQIQPALQPLSNMDLVELEDLQRRHEEERRAVAEIQYKMQQAA